MQLISYKNDEQLKKQFLEEIVKHRKADQIIQGTYGEGTGKEWKGCAVGCSIHSLNKVLKKNFDTSNHEAYETLLGVPEWLARLEDTIFEGLPSEEAKLWPEKFAKAIPVGVDLEPVKWKFSTFLLKENIDRVLSLDIPDDLKKQVVDGIRGVLNVHKEAIKTGKWNESAARSARSAESAARSAWSAAWSAWSAARSAWSAAWSAWSAAWSAESAARSAESAAWSAESAESAAESAESAAYKKYARELLRLLRAAK